MARQWLTGFGAQAVAIDTGANALTSGQTYDTTVKRTGLASLKCVASSGVNNTLNWSIGTGPWHRIYILVTARPASTRRIILGASGSINIRLNPDGTLAYYNSSTSVGTSTAALTDTGRWYRVEWRGGTGTSVPLLLIDGTTEVTGTISAATAQINTGAADTVADTYTVYFADYVQDDANAPGAGAVTLLLPVSDNARAAKWVAGSNATTATTNLWDGVNNTPPIGVATSLPVANGISHEGSAAGTTDDYDANMSTYRAAGVPPGSTINALRAIVAHGEDIATGTKLLTFSVKSNPAQGAFETNFTAGADIGAQGTYPTNWSITRGTIISTPSVTLDTSPVMTVRRPETASRRADVCFMGMNVDYTPPAGYLDPPIIVSQAVSRAALW